MNKYLILAVLSLSTSAAALASRCEVSLVDNYGRVLERIVSYDSENGCKEAMKSCRFEIRQRGLLNRADCVKEVVGVPGPHNPGPHHPTPVPQPVPQPVPVPSYDATRMIGLGETVILDGRYFTVLGMNMHHRYAVKDNFGFITNNIERASLNVTSGCNLDVCVNDNVISITAQRYLTVAGLSYHDRMVLKDNFGFLTMNVDRNTIASTKGCIASYYSQLCVGNQVITTNNNYMTVAGIQANGRVVLKDRFGFLTVNVEPSNLVITR